MKPLLKTFCAFYRSLELQSLENIEAVYADDIELQDPVHRIKGLDAVKTYFATMLANTEYCRFSIERVVEQESEAFVSWQMAFVHQKLGSGKEVTVSGVTHLRFNKRVFYHRDYFDLGEMVYEQLPLLGTAIRAIKNRIAT